MPGYACTGHHVLSQFFGGNVAGETSEIIPDTTVEHPADSFQGLPDAHAIVKQMSTKTKARENRAPQLQVGSVGDDKAAAFLHKPCSHDHLNVRRGLTFVGSMAVASPIA